MPTCPIFGRPGHRIINCTLEGSVHVDCEKSEQLNFVDCEKSEQLNFGGWGHVQYSFITIVTH